MKRSKTRVRCTSSVLVCAFVCALVLTGAAGADEGASPASDDTSQLHISYERYKLDNGLEVILHEDHRTPSVAVSAWYHVGAFHEAPGKTGFAHLFEHLMFQGTPNVGDDKHFSYLEQVGASDINGTTNFDRTNYFQTVPSHELALALWLESDRMGYLMDGVTQAKLDEQRAVVKNERLQSTETAPYGLATEALYHKMYPETHPYYGLVIGSMKDLDSANLDDVRGFYDVFYAPSNATLTIAGDFVPAVAKDMINKYFGTLPTWKQPPPKTIPAPTIQKGFTVEFEEKIGKLPKVHLAWFTPAFFQDGDATLDVLAHILGAGKASILHQALVETEQLAQSVSVGQSSHQNVSTFEIEILLKPESEPNEVVELVFAYLAELSDLPCEPEKIANAINRIETSRLFGLQKLGGFSGKAEQLQLYNHHVGEPDFLAKDLERYKQLSPEQISAAVTKYLSRDHAAILIAKPAASNAEAGEKK